MEPSPHDPVKELTRKLYWAVTSTFPRMSKDQKRSTFGWAADMADRIATRTLAALPPSVDNNHRNSHTGQAVGRGGGRYNPSLPRSDRPPPPPNQEAWVLDQAAMREKAWAHVLEGRQAERQLPLPAECYREVGYGSTNSTGGEGGGEPG